VAFLNNLIAGIKPRFKAHYTTFSFSSSEAKSSLPALVAILEFFSLFINLSRQASLSLGRGLDRLEPLISESGVSRKIGTRGKLGYGVE
jgi:hypothetical protein